MKKSKLLSRLLLASWILVIGIVIHESIHSYIYSRFNVDSTIEWFPSPRTIANSTQVANLSSEELARMQDLHTINEIATYPILVGLILWVLLK
jgi:hypothetical protein